MLTPSNMENVFTVTVGLGFQKRGSSKLEGRLVPITVTETGNSSFVPRG